MKIVIQRGDVVNREDIELLFDKLPSKVKSIVHSFVVYASNGEEAQYQYYSINKTFGFHSPMNSTISKTEAISGIAAHLLAAADLGHLPKEISKSKMQHYQSAWQELCS